MVKIDKFYYVIFIICVAGILFISGMATIMVNMIQKEKAMEKGCNNIGLEDYKYGGDLGLYHCIDKDNHRHFIDFKCKGIISVECKAKIITIGEYRIS